MFWTAALFRAASHRLHYFKAFELGMAKIERLVVTGPLMRGTKGLRLGPRLERRMVRPHRVRGIQRVVLQLRAAQQMEFDEARHLVQMRVARKPDLLEG